ncbi:MAG: DUF1365 domain-containing protein [Opitutia bacterium]|nr:MAG: DUF1365 domain-containing protein [Opitutae bacterium]
MNSCLYECSVMHARFSPRPHRFLYRIFLFAIDLDELPLLHRNLALFSFGHRNLYSFRDGDYLPTGEALHHPPLPPATSAAPPSHRKSETGNLKARVLAHLAASSPTLDLSGARVVLVTLPRVFGYLFNPVSFYFCYDRTGTPVAALSEVTNTFKEMKPYVLGPECRQAATGNRTQKENNLSPVSFTLRTPKHFYVSPFSDVDVAFDFTLRTPGTHLSVQIDDYVGTERTLTSTLAGPRSELTGVRLAWFTLKYPALTLRIIALIHLHAALLWCKRVPWFAKSARSADQRALYRPHSSIARSAPTLSSAHPSEAL